MEDQASMSLLFTMVRKKHRSRICRTDFQSKRMIAFARQNDDSKYDNSKHHNS